MASTISAGTSAGTAIAIAGDTSGALALQTNNGTTAVTIDTSQRVLINATSASGFDSSADNLIVGAGSGSNGITIYSGNTSTAAINFADGTTGSDIYAGGITYNHNTNNLDFSTTDGSTRMRITSGGNVLIGIGTPLPNNTGKITTYATSGSTAGWVSKGNANGYYGSLFENQSDTTVGYIQVNSTTTNFSTTSDYRLKENVAPMTGALNTVSLLKPVTYKWKEDGSDGQGFIAHELAEVMPDCVSGEKDAVNENGKPQYQGIDTSFLVATLTAAIQELNAKVEAQATTIAELQAKVG